MNKTHLRWVVIAIIFSAILLDSTLTRAKEVAVEEEIKAKFITNYIPYTKWPSKVRGKSDPITVCVMAGDITASYIRKVNDNSDKKLSLTVKEKGAKSDFGDCHILYISKVYENYEENLIHITRNKPILTISDIPGFSEHGGITGFQLTQGKDVQLEVNMKSVEASGLDIDTDLIAIMKVFK